MGLRSGFRRADDELETYESTRREGDKSSG